MNPLLQLIQFLFGGMTTPGSAGGLSPALMAQLGITPPTPAGGANPGLFTSLGGAIDPADPLTGILRMIAGGFQIPFAQQGEGAINKGLNVLENPAQFTGLVKNLAMPLNADLVRSLKQMAEGTVAESGLGQSPGAVASAVAKAAAPYENARIDTSMNTAMQQMMALLSSGNLPGSPYANIAKMFTGGQSELGGSLY